MSSGIAHAQTQNEFVLAVSGNHFTINGTPKFLVFISYFDALDVSDAQLENDLTYLKSKGIDGIRIFPNWWTYTDRFTKPAAAYAGDTLIDPGGDIREGSFSNLIYVLNKAKEHQMVVDISLSAETVSSSTSGPGTLTYNELAVGLSRLTTRLKGDGYRHVLFDLQNEVDKGDNGPVDAPHMSPSQVLPLVDNVVHAIDPNRIVTASFTSTPYTVDQNAHDARDPQIADNIKQYTDQMHGSVVTYHDPRDQSYYLDDTTTWNNVGTVTTNLSGSKPVYLQEPERYRPAGTDNGPNDTWLTHDKFLNAVASAKNHGAAAWCFHTSAGSYMNDVGIAAHLQAYPEETTFLDNLLPTLNGTAWGISAGIDAAPSVPTVTSPGYPALVDFTGDHRADIGEWYNPNGQFWIRANTINSFAPAGTNWGGGNTVTPTAGWEVLIADFNGDGFADYMDHHIPSGKFWIHLANGAGGFNPNVWVTGTTRAGVDVEVFPGDVNGDHWADLIEHNRTTGELHVRVNTGVGDPVVNADVINEQNFQLLHDPATLHTAVGSDWRTIVADFTGDGYVDVADYHVPSAHFWIHNNVGGYQWNGGNWADFGAFSYPGFTTIFGDFTGDGWADYADVNLGSGEFWVHENLHNGTFSGANWSYAVFTHSPGFRIMGLPIGF